MTRRQALALTLAGAAIAPGASLALAQSSAGLKKPPLPTRATLSRLGLERAWYAVTPISDPTERILTANLTEDTIFVQTNRANLHSFGAETGQRNWSVNLGRDSLDTRPVSLNSQMAFVTNGPILFALDRRTGRIVWEKRLDSTAEGATAANEERVVVGLANGKLVAYNVRDHTDTNPPGQSAGTFAWAWQTGAKITARPIPAGKVMAFASQDGRVYVGVEDSKTILFRYRTGGPIVGSMGTHGSQTLIVPSTDGILYAINLFTGDTLWKLSGGSPFEQEPIIDRDRVIVVTKTGLVLVVDAKSGTLLRSADIGGGRLLSVSESRGYVESPDRDLAIVDRASGQVSFTTRDTRERAGLDLRDYTIAVTNHLNDRLYFATPGGFLLSLREAGQTVPRLLRDPKALVFGSLPPDGEPVPPATPPAAGDAGDAKPDPDADPAKKDGN